MSGKNWNTKMTSTLSIHQFSVRDLTGNEVQLSDYKGKVLLIVNTASQCGFTPQLTGLEKLRQDYGHLGFEVLAFPSNDFGQQEPLEGEAISEFCSLNHEATYPIFEKVHVVGDRANELFQFLSSKQQNGRFSVPPRWNFYKYLIDQEGRVVDYFVSFTAPEARRLRRKIEALLSKD